MSIPKIRKSQQKYAQVKNAVALTAGKRDQLGVNIRKLRIIQKGDRI